MVMIDDLVFVDTNVLVYAYDETEPTRGPAAQKIVTELWTSGHGVLSTQVLQEFYSVATKKIPKPLSRLVARELVADFSQWQIVNTDPLLIVSASRLAEDHSLAWWDALIISAALRSGAPTLLSEDLQHGRRFGRVTVRNPFRAE